MTKKLFRAIAATLLLFSPAAQAASDLPLISGRDANDKVVSLDGSWQLTFWKQQDEPVTDPAKISGLGEKTIEARVPGNIEFDLMNAGLMEDPMIGSNSYKMRPYEGYQWCFAREFLVPAVSDGQCVVLRFGGIDTYADIWLNGEHLASTDNMLVTHDFDITDRVSSGNNRLQVVIRSTVIEGQKQLLPAFSQSFAQNESVWVRKAPHMYGWDILPRLVSAGLWRSVELRVVEPLRLVDVHWYTAAVDVPNKNGRVHMDWHLRAPFDMYDGLRTVVTLSYEGKEVYKASIPTVTHAGRHMLNVEDAKFWWPKGYGEPAALYDGKVELVDKSGKVWSVDERKVGIRTVKLDYNEINDKPSNPGKFCFVVNGEKIFIRGTNWVPIDALHSRDSLNVETTVRMVADMNCNMIRCWGGNVYEDTPFFDLCDREGIMIWQDFAMGCTFYPQQDRFAKAIEEEATKVVLKLRTHPSVALWSGNNEDDASLRWTMLPFNINPNEDVVTRKTLSMVLYELDPTRTYLPSSPYYSQAVWERGSGDEWLPENHLWGPRGYYKDPFYTTATCQFVSEIGYHGCPNRESLEKMFTKDAVYPWTDKNFTWNEQWLSKAVRIHPEHGYTPDRNNLMINQVNLLFGEKTDDLDTFIFASQSVQAEAMKYFMEKWRGAKFDDKTGIIWWNIRDGWPVISDAVVDYYNSKKMAYYFIANVQHSVCVLINDAVDGTLPLVVANDTREAATGKTTVTDIETGKKIWSGDYSVDANGRSVITRLPEPSGQGVYLIEYETPQGKLKNHYLYGKAPFPLKKYKEWMKKTEIYDIK